MYNVIRFFEQHGKEPILIKRVKTIEEARAYIAENQPLSCGSFLGWCSTYIKPERKVKPC